MRLALRTRLEQILEASITNTQPLAGGCLSSCARLRLSDGRDVVVKFGAGHFLLEARMLSDLAAALSSSESKLGAGKQFFCRVPRVYHADEDMLAMQWIDHARGVSGSRTNDKRANDKRKSSYEAGCLLAYLHANSSDSFGYDYDTPLGELLQDNRRTSSWIDFYRERRLLPLAAKCLAIGELDAELHKKLLTFAEEKLDGLLGNSPTGTTAGTPTGTPAGTPTGTPTRTPALLHGDLWGGNMLFDNGGTLQGLLDPALYYGDGQVDLAMLRLFPCCDASFFAGYRATTNQPLDRASEDLCQEIYGIYPLLVHCLFFGRRYQPALARVLHRYL